MVLGFRVSGRNGRLTQNLTLVRWDSRNGKENGDYNEGLYRDYYKDLFLPSYPIEGQYNSIYASRNHGVSYAFFMQVKSPKSQRLRVYGLDRVCWV